MKRRFLFAVVWVLAASVPPASLAQTEPTFQESVSVGYVVVPFVALDHRGRAIRDLRERDVKVLVDGRRVALDMFERTERAPVSYTILLDGSGSMALAGKFETAVTAVQSLIAKHVSGDDYSLYVFSSRGVREVVPFTEDGSAIVRAMLKVTPFGKTAFYDALALMPDKSILGRNGSRAIILLTDGLDNASQMTAAELTRILEGVDVPVYPLGLRLQPPNVETPGEEKSDVALLTRIAALTGGRVAFEDGPQTVDAAMNNITHDLRAQYIVGFSPTGRGGVKYRAISLQLPRRVRSVRVRAGYRGTEPPPWSAGARAKK